MGIGLLRRYHDQAPVETGAGVAEAPAPAPEPKVEVAEAPKAPAAKKAAPKGK